MKTYFFIGIMVCTFAVGVNEASASESPMPSLMNCKNIAEDSIRLACYDEIVTGGNFISVATVVEPESDPVVTDEDSFGSDDLLSTQKELRKKREKIKSITSQIIEIAKNGNKKYVVILENGQIWRQLKADTDKLRVPVSGAAGMSATIQRKGLGGHLLHLNGENRSIRVERIK